MVNDNESRFKLRGIGRGLERCLPLEEEMPDSIQSLLDALRERDRNEHDRNGYELNGHGINSRGAGAHQTRRAG